MPIVSSSEVRLFYEVIDVAAPWCDRPATILLHHGIGAESGIWAEWIAALADRYRLVRFDMRGFGRSDAPGLDGWSMSRLAGDLLAVADATETERFHFVGESMGGTIGLHAAAHHPDRLLSLTMSNAAHIGGAIQNVEHWRRLINQQGMSGWSEELMRHRFHADALTPAQYDWFLRQQASASPASVLNALSVLVGVDLSPALAAIKMPVLLLHPDGTPFIPVSVVAGLRDGLPDAELNVFGHARHGLPFSHGRACGQALRRFLDRRFADAPAPKH